MKTLISAFLAALLACFPATITGASINISAPLSAAAPALTLLLTGGSGCTGLAAGQILYATSTTQCTSNTALEWDSNLYGGLGNQDGLTSYLVPNTTSFLHIVMAQIGP